MATTTTVPKPDPDLDTMFDNDDDLVLNAKAIRAFAAHDDIYADLKSPQVMMLYYKKLLPWKQLFLWLNQDHVPNKSFTHREFAFTLQNDAYLRYCSFSSHLDLQRETLRLNPSRFEIGPIYSSRPRDRKTVSKAAFKPLRRELVFDIDMTDYDEVRSCCSDKKICKRCWKFIAMAVKVLDSTLRIDFGFKHLLWVFSGRRGIHCWVSDSAALILSDDERKAMVNYLEVVKGGAKQDKRVDLGRRPLHPTLNRACEQLKNSFVETVLKDQHAFDSQEKWEGLLRAVPDREVVKNLTEKWSANEVSSNKKWTDLRASLAAQVPTKNPTREQSIKASKAQDFLTDTVLQYTYPRIDTEVSKHLNHLLKSPFCVHPETGKVCVPVEAEKVEEFDPDKVPDVRDLLRELEKAEGKGQGQSGEGQEGGWEKTAMKGYVEIFERHVQGVLKDAQAEKELSKTSRWSFDLQNQRCAG